MNRATKTAEDETTCKALTKKGKPCRAAAFSDGLCYFHANPHKAKELGRIGGMKNRHSVVDDYSAPLPPLDNALSLRDALARMIADLHSKKLHPRTAAGLATLTKTLLRAIEVVNANDMERRIAKLEQLVEAAELSKNGSESGSVHTTSPTTANEPPRPNGVPRVPEEET